MGHDVMPCGPFFMFWTRGQSVDTSGTVPTPFHNEGQPGPSILEDSYKTSPFRPLHNIAKPTDELRCFRLVAGTTSRLEGACWPLDIRPHQGQGCRRSIQLPAFPHHFGRRCKEPLHPVSRPNSIQSSSGNVFSHARSSSARNAWSFTWSASSARSY